LQAGGVPLWIAGGGERKTLRIAAQHAAYTNFEGSLEGFKRKSEVLAEHCRELGRDVNEIVRSANYNVVIGRDADDVEARLAAIRARYEPYLAPEQLDAAVQQFRSGPLVGPPELIVERLTELHAAGMSYAITYFTEAAHDTSGIELFVNEVMPHVP
jgi:alkanesulfonate monooxygenase SsuD/methylene tetrahydromethanopterin reductase-like flavin-dependent oxidoreductase (luciferase family)